MEVEEEAEEEEEEGKEEEVEEEVEEGSRWERGRGQGMEIGTA